MRLRMVAAVRQRYNAVLIWKSSSSPHSVSEAAFSVVVNCSIAEVEAPKANTGCLVLVVGADGKAGPLPEEGRQVDGGGDDNRQASD